MTNFVPDLKTRRLVFYVKQLEAWMVVFGLNQIWSRFGFHMNLNSNTPTRQPPLFSLSGMCCCSALLPCRLALLPLLAAVAVRSTHCHHSSASCLKKEAACVTPLMSHAASARSTAAVCFCTTAAASMRNSSTHAPERLLKH
jgi:hypothetical protein